jgi:hypothetical protein
MKKVPPRMRKGNGSVKWMLALVAAVLLSLELFLTLFTVDLIEWLCLLGITVVVLGLLALAFYTKRLAASAAVAAFIVYCLTTSIVLKQRNEIRTNTRWFLWSKRYKAQVIATDTAKGELKHREWDGWGFAGADTTVYLVFDPSDLLLTAARNHSSGKFAGIPCEVPLVHRLEDHWYTVLFYTDIDWQHCA